MEGAILKFDVDGRATNCRGTSVLLYDLRDVAIQVGPMLSNMHWLQPVAHLALHVTALFSLPSPLIIQIHVQHPP